jgi:glucosyl-3-phosphoglycerate synthase
MSSVAVCIPARDEARTIEPIVATCMRLVATGEIDQVIVVDDHSTDDTGQRARRLGASVVEPIAGPGKGEALRCAVGHAEADILVFLDADVRNFTERFVTDLAAPLRRHSSLQLVKAAYRRPLDGRADEGGRVTELMAKPLLARFFPELAAIRQPLAGECAIRRTVLDDVWLADGYGIELALLIDVYERYGIDAISEVDLGARVHRNRPLHELRPHAHAALAAVLERVGSLTTGGTTWQVS